MSLTHMYLPCNTQLQNGKYTIEKILGQGGFGITYLATHNLFGKKVAIKEFFFKEFCERESNGLTVTVPTQKNREQVERLKTKFLKEARMILSLNHPNIIRVMDVFEENGTSYYAMEYIEGETVSSYIKRYGPMTEEYALSVIGNVANALAYLHQKGINHLDVKPANIMMDYQNNRVILIDFGISKQYDTRTGDGTTTTQVGVSHGFSPLEQYNDGGVATFSPQSDIYALGATLYKMITGKTPPNAIELSQQGGMAVPGSISSNVANAIVLAMLPIKQDRPASIAQWMAILEGKDVIDDGNNGGTSKRKWPLWVAAVGAGLLVVGGITFALLSGKHSSGSFSTTDPITQIDSFTTEDPYEEEETFKWETLKESRPSKFSDQQLTMTIEYPVGGNKILVQNVREWINEQLGGTYEGDLDDYEAFFNYYCKKYFEEEDENIDFNLEITHKYDTDKAITYIYDFYSFGEGAMHGLGVTIGSTFRKSDGKRFTMDMINGVYQLQPDFKAGLKQYFECTTDEELAENLFDEENINNLPAPQTDPWITDEGVVFYYGSYEICAYAFGTPTFTIPFSRMRDVLNATGKTFLD